jgi:transcriptional regulator with PAS, ATPase and Fis domain
VAIHVDAAVTVEDLGSSNGTVLNGKRLKAGEPQRLPAGAVVEVGLATLVIRSSEGGQLRASARASQPDEASGVHESTMNRVYRLIDMVAASEISVLLLGETGVGKEVTAEAIHEKSKRAGRPMVRINCAAMPESLLESELFGYERGAFTGAQAAKPGLMESAEGGTLFLDEVADLPLATQAKLLRVVETREVQRIGALRPQRVDVRVIAATNADLEERVASGSFRRDLYYRLNGLSITLPPLRNRSSDIPALASGFVEDACRRAGRPAPAIAPEVMDRLKAFAWPGNIRELRNVMERACVLCDRGPIRLAHVPPEIAAPPVTRSTPAPEAAAGLRDDIEAFERQRIVDALEKCDGNQTKAAKLLGISRRMLVNRLDLHRLPRPRKKDE